MHEILTGITVVRSPGLPVDGDQYDGVGDDDDGERHQVHHDHAKDGVRGLVLFRGEGVERHALSVPREVRVHLHVEYVHLQKRKARFTRRVI